MTVAVKEGSKVTLPMSDEPEAVYEVGDMSRNGKAAFLYTENRASFFGPLYVTDMREVE